MNGRAVNGSSSLVLPSKQSLDRLLRIEIFNVVRHILSMGHIGQGSARIEPQIQEISKCRRLVQFRKDQLVVRHLLIGIRYADQIPVFCGGAQNQMYFFLNDIVNGMYNITHIIFLCAVLVGMSRRIDHNIVISFKIFQSLTDLLHRVNHAEGHLQNVRVGAQLLSGGNTVSIRRQKSYLLFLIYPEL